MPQFKCRLPTRSRSFSFAFGTALYAPQRTLALVGGAPALDQKSRPSCDSRLAPKPEAVDRARLVDKLVADKRDALIRRRAPKALPVRVRPVRACARRHAPGRAGARGNARTASPWRSAPRRGRAALPSNNARRRQRLDAQCPHARV